jgi:hypothetical protein
LFGGLDLAVEEEFAFRVASACVPSESASSSATLVMMVGWFPPGSPAPVRARARPKIPATTSGVLRILSSVCVLVFMVYEE